MLRLGIAACAVGALALADGFTFTIGSPVASQDFQAKSAAFVFRTESCADPAKSQIDATAEGLVKGARRSVPLKVVAMSNGSTPLGPGDSALNDGDRAPLGNLTMIISSPDHLGR